MSPIWWFERNVLQSTCTCWFCTIGSWSGNINLSYLSCLSSPIYPIRPIYPIYLVYPIHIFYPIYPHYPNYRVFPIYPNYPIYHIYPIYPNYPVFPIYPNYPINPNYHNYPIYSILSYIFPIYPNYPIYPVYLMSAYLHALYWATIQFQSPSMTQKTSRLGRVRQPQQEPTGWSGRSLVSPKMFQGVGLISGISCLKSLRGKLKPMISFLN